MKTLQILEFSTQSDWKRWLGKNPGQTDGVWLKLAKKHSGVLSLKHPEALETALCYGWIDGQVDKFDEKYWLVKFSPRRPRSVWSKRNCEKVERLIAEGRMKPSGMAQVNAAKADGRWDAAYEPQSTAEVPQDFLQALAKDERAAEFYETLNRSERYAIFWRLHHSKRAEARAAKIEEFVARLANHQTSR